jgi:hypothetical protein
MIDCKIKEIELEDTVIDVCDMQDTDISGIDFNQCKRYVE